MDLETRIEEELTTALRAGDVPRKNTLRLVRAAIKNASIEAGGGPIGDEAVVGILQKQAKQRGDSIEQFERAGRDDLVMAEKEELAIIQTFLPRQLTDEEVEAVVLEHIAAVGATGPGDIGKVMAPVMNSLKGAADGQRVSKIVRRILAG